MASRRGSQLVCTRELKSTPPAGLLNIARLSNDVASLMQWEGGDTQSRCFYDLFYREKESSISLPQEIPSRYRISKQTGDGRKPHLEYASHAQAQQRRMIPPPEAGQSGGGCIKPSVAASLSVFHLHASGSSLCAFSIHHQSAAVGYVSGRIVLLADMVSMHPSIS